MISVNELSMIDYVLEAAESGLDNVESHPEYSALQKGAAAGSNVSALPARYKITGPQIGKLREALAATGGILAAHGSAEEAEDIRAEGERNWSTGFFAALAAVERNLNKIIAETVPEDEAQAAVDMFFDMFPGARIFLQHDEAVATVLHDEALAERDTPLTEDNSTDVEGNQTYTSAPPVTTILAAEMTTPGVPVENTPDPATGDGLFASAPSDKKKPVGGTRRRRG